MTMSIYTHYSYNHSTGYDTFQFLHRPAKFAIVFFVESGEPEVADTRLHLKGQIHGVMRNFVARDVENQRVRVTLAGDGYLNGRAARSPQKIGDFRCAHALHGLVINVHDDVPRTNSRTECRTPDIRSHHYGALSARNHSHAHAVIPAAHFFPIGRPLARVKEIRVWI